MCHNMLVFWQLEANDNVTKLPAWFFFCCVVVPPGMHYILTKNTGDRKQAHKILTTS